MGMHFGFVAAKTSVARLREAFTRVWAHYEIVAEADSLPDPNAMWAWKESIEALSATERSTENVDREVFLFWQDGPWAVVLDDTYILSSDEEELKTLSTQVGTVLSFVVETAGGCAVFSSYVDGKLRRKIDRSDGKVSTEGEPLSEEAGIDISGFYMDEAESLWRAFGLSRFEGMPTSIGCQAICVIDGTDNLDI